MPTKSRWVISAAPNKKTGASWAPVCILAEREGFEPSIRGYRIHTFQACSFSRSDTSPENKRARLYQFSPNRKRTAMVQVPLCRLSSNCLIAGLFGIRACNLRAYCTASWVRPASRRKVTSPNRISAFPGSC